MAAREAGCSAETEVLPGAMGRGPGATAVVLLFTTEDVIIG